MKKVFILAAAVLMMAGCQNKNAEQKEHLRCVEVIKPQPLSGESVLTYSGKVKETKQVNVAFKTGGPIDKIHVRVGDHVKKGQLLAEIESSDYMLGVKNYEAQYKQLKSEVERIKVLYERKSVSQNDYEKAVTGLKQLEVALQSSHNKVKYCKLYAPSDGVILAVNYNPSELVDAGMAVFSLLEDTELQVIFDIPASVYQDQEQFERFYCLAAFEPEKRVPMTLATITPKADGNNLYRVYLDFKGNADKRFTPGTSVQVEIYSKPSDNGQHYVSVPLRTICQREAEPFVWGINPDSTLRKQVVTIASLESQGNARISSGLDGTETLVRAGASTLQEGEKVRILDSNSQTNIGNQL